MLKNNNRFSVVLELRRKLGCLERKTPNENIQTVVNKIVGL